MNSDEGFKCAGILLAAGAASRMGQPKQLLPIHGEPLVCHVAGNLRAAAIFPVIVVLGAHAAEIKPALEGMGVTVIVNEAWRDGLSSSVRAGLAHLQKIAPATEAAILALADQPDVTPEHFNQLIATHRSTGKPAVSAISGGVMRPPALFVASWFPRLAGLTGDSGARGLLQAEPESVATVALPAATDLDTPEDYRKFTA